MIKTKAFPPLTKEEWERLEARFWKRVERRNNKDCWLWNGTTNGHGYGRITPVNHNRYKECSQYVSAPRLSWRLHHGSFPPEQLLCCHSCDNPLCVNIYHLWIGTAKQNAHDMIRKGRAKGIAAFTNLNKKVSAWKNMYVSPDQPGMTKLP